MILEGEVLKVFKDLQLLELAEQWFTRIDWKWAMANRRLVFYWKEWRVSK